MDPADYRRFTEHLRRWAEHHSDVVGLVAVGSMAERGRLPDEWSDHDFWVVTRAGAAAAIRDDPTWLPDPERVVLFYAETQHGRNAVYDDGHLVEQAVFDDSELEVARATEYRVLVDKGGIEARMAAIAHRTAATGPAQDAGDVFGRFVGQLVIGLTRYGRGELLSAESMVKKWALENLLMLIATGVPREVDVSLDDLDPRRRIEAAYPDLGGRLVTAMGLPVPAAALVMIEVAEDRLTGIAANTPAVRAVLRRLARRAGG